MRKNIKSGIKRVWNNDTFWGRLTSISTLVVAITIVPLSCQLEVSKNVATSDFIVKMHGEFNSPRMLKIRKDVAKLDFKKSENLSGCEDILDFFDKIAYLEKTGVMNLDAVSQTWGYWIERYWLLCKDHVHNFRSKEIDSSYYKSVENLSERLMLRKSKETGISVNEYTKKIENDLENFKQEESELI